MGTACGLLIAIKLRATHSVAVTLTEYATC